MNNKDKPTKCEAEVCCKATAKLQMEVAKEIMEEDKSLLELLAKADIESEEDVDEDTDSPTD